MRNDRICAWFDSGEIQQALLGRGSYFISDTINRSDHDRVFVTRQLLHWADTMPKQQEAANAIENAIRQAARVDDVRPALDIYLCFHVVTKTDQKSLPVRFDQVIQEIGDMLQRNEVLISGDDNLKYFAQKMAEKFPELRPFVAHIT